MCVSVCVCGVCVWAVVGVVPHLRVLAEAAGFAVPDVHGVTGVSGVTTLAFVLEVIGMRV